MTTRIRKMRQNCNYEFVESFLRNRKYGWQKRKLMGK